MVSRPAAAPRPREAEPAPAGQPLEGAPPAGAPPAALAPAMADKKDSLDFSDFEFSESPQDFQIEVDVDPVDADVEQVAVLYANGQDAAARALLENSVRIHHSGPGERLWLMLFDFYRVTSQKSAFETLEIDYAQAFEKSPPAWRDSSKVQTEVAAVAGSALFKGSSWVTMRPASMSRGRRWRRIRSFVSIFPR